MLYECIGDIMYSASNHPIIPSPVATIRDVADPNVDMFFATISSVDRNVVKYPQTNSFTVDLPQEYTNVTSISLQHSFFPNVCIDFTLDKNNVDLVFRFTEIPATPSIHLEVLMYVAIKHSIDNNNYYRIRISDGSYTQEQLLLEVQNRMNHIVESDLLYYYNNNIQQTTYRWGDHMYSNSGQNTIDGHSIMFHSRYTTIDQAVLAYNSIAGTEGTLNLETSNAFAHKHGTARTPPPVLVVPSVQFTTDFATGDGNYATINSVANGTSGSYPEYMKHLLTTTGGYAYFKLFYDKIQKKIVFGNSISAFEVITDFENYYTTDTLNAAGARYRTGNTSSCKPICDNTKTEHVNYVNWGLPIYIGFSGKEKLVTYTPTDPLPTFYYYNKNTEPNSYNPFQHATTTGFAASPIYTMTPCNQLNTETDVYYYMELDGLNMIDELIPYKNDAYAVTTGTTTGLINSIFAKRTILADRSDQFQIGRGEEKTFTPPLRRMNKVSVRIRYHDGTEPNFGSMPFDFTLKLVCQKNQLGRSSNPGFPAPA
jgi:hypothetical protein